MSQSVVSQSVSWYRISDHLYRFEDICSVYALVANGEAVLIDFGTGAALDHLGEIGVGRVQAIRQAGHPGRER